MEMYRSFSAKYKGAKHEGEEPCQDAVLHLPLEEAHIIAVADGHGSSRCFRSDYGSQIAIEIAEKIVKHFVENTSDIDPDNFILTIKGLVKQLINSWFTAVMKHEQANPLENDSMLAQVDDKYRDRYLGKDKEYDHDYRCHAYGTTLTVAAMTSNYWFGFHVGDGKCIALYEDGSWRFPIPWDDRCNFNITTSICDDDSLSGFRYWFGTVDSDNVFKEYGYGVDGQHHDYDPNPVVVPSRPLAIFMGSDGVEDSYPRVDNDDYVKDFYRNRIITLAESGFESFTADLDNYAKHFAEHRSEDDVSIATIVGDITDRGSMIKRMKIESAHHEACWKIEEKRRDAEEKMAAYTAMESRTNAEIARKRQLEGRITSIEQELDDFETKKKSYESALSRTEAEVSASARDMSDVQNESHKLERERAESLGEERRVTEKITFANNDVRIAQKNYDKAEKDYESKLKAYNKYLHKVSAMQSSAPTVLLQNPKIVVTQTSDSITFTKVGEPNPASQPNVPTSTPTAVVPDTNMRALQKKVNTLNNELKTSEAQAVATRQNIEAKSRELADLKLKLLNVQQHTQRIESDIDRARRDSQAVEAQIRDQRNAVRQYQNEIADIERHIKGKKAELLKLTAEFETHKEQTKKQTDTLAVIREAWKKAKAEAVALEATIQKGKQDEEE